MLHLIRNDIKMTPGTFNKIYFMIDKRTLCTIYSQKFSEFVSNEGTFRTDNDSINPPIPLISTVFSTIILQTPHDL